MEFAPIVAVSGDNLLPGTGTATIASVDEA